MNDIVPSDGTDGPILNPENPARGTPESAAWFRQMLVDLEETQASMARLMKRKGDDRKPESIARHMRRMATGEARVSGEMRVVLTMMLRAKQRGEKRTAEKRADQPAAVTLPASSSRT